MHRYFIALLVLTSTIKRMEHSNRPIIDNSDQMPRLRPYAKSSVGVPIYPLKDMAVRKAQEDVKKHHEPRFVVEMDDGFLSVSYTEYFLLFGDAPGDDVIRRFDP